MARTAHPTVNIVIPARHCAVKRPRRPSELPDVEHVASIDGNSFGGTIDVATRVLSALDPLAGYAR